jgi:uncharacterized membrane protein YqgA involved in biofilm formation
MLAGTILNALGILIGGILGLATARQFSSSTQIACRGIMGILTVFIGLRITLLSLSGTFLQNLRQLAILVIALAAGKMLGQLFRIQKTMNRLGQYASRRFAETKPGDPHRFNDGFLVCTLVFCAGPLGIVGAVLAGLMNSWEPLAIKMAMDGLAAMGFACVFGWSVLLSAIPLFVFQTMITLAAMRCQPFLSAHGSFDAVTGVAGLLVFCVALIVLELKKLAVADYLPSLLLAPLIVWLWN